MKTELPDSTPPDPQPVVDIDDEELVDDEEIITKIPRSGKRQLMPIERLR